MVNCAFWVAFVLLEQDTRFELAPSAWKADMLAANTNPAYLLGTEILL